MSIAAYKTEVKVGGVPVAVTAQLTEDIGTIHRIFRITDPLKRVIDSSVPVVVKNASNGDILTAQSINYLEGVIYLTSEEEDGIKVDYSYIPLAFAGGTKEYNLELGGDLLDVTAFHDATTNNPGYRQRINGLTDVKCSFSRFDDLIKTLRIAKMAKSKILIVIKPGGAESRLRASGWYVNETLSASGDVGAAEEESFSYSLAGDMQTNFSFVFDYTTLEAQALTEQQLLDNYFFGLTA